MRDEYDFSNAIKNPYVAKNKQQITIRLDQQVIDYFKDMSEETGMPYQNIINYYLLQCVKEEKQMVIQFQNQSTLPAAPQCGWSKVDRTPFITDISC